MTIDNPALSAPRPRSRESSPTRPAKPRSRFYRGLEELTEIVAFGFKLVATIPRLGVSGWREFVDQAWIVARRCTIPMAISQFAFTFSTSGRAGAGLLDLLGTSDRIGGLTMISSVREVSPFVTGMTVAGVAGTAICADLGARKIKGEIDALLVMGVDPIRTMVVPRFLALGLMTSLISFVGLVFALAAGLAASSLVYGQPLSAFTSTMGTGLTVVSLLGLALKTGIFGLIIATTACYKGMNVSGGAEGVGRAVNNAVVIAFASIFIVNFTYNSVILAAFPSIGDLR